MTIHFYGIPNCDTVKKARGWLDTQGHAYTFHDYKKEGADPDLVRSWVHAVGWERVLNRQGTTFRKLEAAQKENLDQERAIRLMVAQPSCIRRPVLDHPGGLLVGFDAAEWEAALA
ncbi:putative reductase [Tsuneonella dongtanensis]|uniref:Putative reductase n=1 Tax=Tsuneonella dongtanensis TaxID=692370 RepID=A0A1B2AB43_9SPHN|nr:arsenate reductase [Tsuneonella dongtanensis]ANY19298.1 putative reductase [Tsuneonella dongtanensis]